MIFEYTVKYNGKYYPAGSDVPMESDKTATSDNKGVAVVDEAPVTEKVAEEPKATKETKKKSTKKETK
jgi:hypothetical protein